MVLPVPKTAGDGGGAPPLAMGNMVSTTRMPVISGRWAGMRACTGRGAADGPFLAQGQFPLAAVFIG